MILSRIALLVAAVVLGGCETKKEDPAIDACQVNVDCTLVQLDGCCSRSTCDSDLRAETSARTRARLDACATKECVKADPGCKSTNPRVGSFCREGKCVVAAN